MLTTGICIENVRSWFELCPSMQRRAPELCLPWEEPGMQRLLMNLVEARHPQTTLMMSCSSSTIQHALRATSLPRFLKSPSSALFRNWGFRLGIASVLTQNNIFFWSTRTSGIATLHSIYVSSSLHIIMAAKYTRTTFTQTSVCPHTLTQKHTL